MKFISKPVEPKEIDAIRFDGHNFKECIDFTDSAIVFYSVKDEKGGEVKYWFGVLHSKHGSNMVVDAGSWIIKDETGDIYPCKDDIFHKTYDISPSMIGKE